MAWLRSIVNVSLVVFAADPLSRVAAFATKHSFVNKDPLFGSIKTSEPAQIINSEELEQSLRQCESARQARDVYERFLQPGDASVLFGSISVPPGASARGLSDGNLAIQTRLVNKKYQIMDVIELSGDRDADRASLTLLCLTVASTMSAIVANQNLPGPEIIRFLVVWLLSFAPLFFVGYGIAAPTRLQALLVSLQRALFPAYRKRMLQHEAGHFLLAHLLGYPIEAYQANAVKNAVAFYPLKDTRLGQDRARQLGFEAPLRADTNGANYEQAPADGDDSSYFGSGGRGAEMVERQSVFRNQQSNSTNNQFAKLPSQNDPSEAWPYRGFDEATLDQLSVISVAGVCAEILAFGNAEGGMADLSQLRQIFGAADEEVSDRDADNRIRFSLGYTMSQLRMHLGALDALAEAMERDASVAECVVAIESCKNVDGRREGTVGGYELYRREQFRQEGVGLIEQLFLGGEKTIDEEEDQYVDGKGGGYRKESFRLTGDDPLYAALAMAVGFFVWASSGGLSLH